ncbi:hypothetical protein GEMRC1_000320 [Eukaryota sp. GEM-RC1]
METLGRFCSSLDVSVHTSKITHLLFRVLQCPSISDHSKDVCLFTLCCLAYRVSIYFLPFITMTRLLITDLPLSSNRNTLESTIKAILDNDLSSVEEVKVNRPDYSQVGTEVSQSNLVVYPDFRPIEDALSASNLHGDSALRAWKTFCCTFLESNPNGVILSCRGLINLSEKSIYELFCPAFYTQWKNLDDAAKLKIREYLYRFLNTDKLPVFILQSILKLCEFMEFERESIGICQTKLFTVAKKLGMSAKALFYLESSFAANPTFKTAQDLISTLTELGMSECIEGVLSHCRLLQCSFIDQLQGSCASLEMRGKWSDAIKEYSSRIDHLRTQEDLLSSTNRHYLASLELGRLRSVQGLGDWDQLSDLCQNLFNDATVTQGSYDHSDLSSIAIHAHLNLSQYGLLHHYTDSLPTDSAQDCLWKAVVNLTHRNLDDVTVLLEQARIKLDGSISAILEDSHHDRLYPKYCIAQHITEVEELHQICYNCGPESIHEDTFLSNPCNDWIINRLVDGSFFVPTESPLGQQLVRIRKLWKKRLLGTIPEPFTWLSNIMIHNIALDHVDHYETILKFCSVCVNRGKFQMARKTIDKLIVACENVKGKLQSEENPLLIQSYSEKLSEVQRNLKFSEIKLEFAMGNRSSSIDKIDDFIQSNAHQMSGQLHCRSLVKLSEWTYGLHGDSDIHYRRKVINYLKTATALDSTWQHAWHCLGLYAGRAVKRYADYSYVEPAISAFLKSMSSKGEDNTRNTLQDTLRLLQLWFRLADSDSVDARNSLHNVHASIQASLITISPKVWLLVLPQLIARFCCSTVPTTTRTMVNGILSDILLGLSKQHLHALIYPLTVADNTSPSTELGRLMHSIKAMNQSEGDLIYEAQNVAKSLVKLSVIRMESWQAAINQVAALCNSQRFDELHQYLRPFVEEMKEPTDIPHEILFNKTFGSLIDSAWRHFDAYILSVRGGRAQTRYLSDAMRFFDDLQSRLGEKIKFCTYLELHYACPHLLKSFKVKLPIPGGYAVNKKAVNIFKFLPRLSIYPSKQRPRRLHVIGDDGHKYDYLLKGREDLRQDERVMQLYGLINSLMFQNKFSKMFNSKSVRHDLSIQRYAVIPLAAKSGLFGFVPRSDTLRQLHKTYRDSFSTSNSPEDHTLICRYAGNQESYPKLRHIHKLAIFEKIINSTPDDCYAQLFWLTARSSEAWLEHRAYFTRSLAVISMVGYLLGLGDRHPSNMMVLRETGKVFHIDHGDCFEAAIHREKYPETIPFRLTRMLTRAMEMTGVEGSFRLTCESTMSMLRENRDPLMAMLEVFVYDPLITWKKDTEEQTGVIAHNDTAVGAIDRVNAKLSGRDFDSSRKLNVPEQVELLFREAMDVDNLCELYIGWSATC